MKTPCKSCSLILPAFLFALVAFFAAAPPASAATRYVNLNNSTPAAPYTDWATAATSIQDAVEVAVAGDLLLLTNGVHQTGSREVYGMSNRVAVTKPVTVQSVNGPANSIIWGYWMPGTTKGDQSRGLA
jgi:hypothetical protein